MHPFNYIRDRGSLHSLSRCSQVTWTIRLTSFICLTTSIILTAAEQGRQYGSYFLALALTSSVFNCRPFDQQCSDSTDLKDTCLSRCLFCSLQVLAYAHATMYPCQVCCCSSGEMNTQDNRWTHWSSHVARMTYLHISKGFRLCNTCCWARWRCKCGMAIHHTKCDAIIIN